MPSAAGPAAALGLKTRSALMSGDMDLATTTAAGAAQNAAAQAQSLAAAAAAPAAAAQSGAYGWGAMNIASQSLPAVPARSSSAGRPARPVAPIFQLGHRPAAGRSASAPRYAHVLLTVSLLLTFAHFLLTFAHVLLNFCSILLTYAHFLPIFCSLFTPFFLLTFSSTFSSLFGSFWRVRLGTATNYSNATGTASEGKYRSNMPLPVADRTSLTDPIACEYSGHRHYHHSPYVHKQSAVLVIAD